VESKNSSSASWREPPPPNASVGALVRVSLLPPLAVHDRLLLIE
jgi:hypothetical protein